MKNELIDFTFILSQKQIEMLLSFINCKVLALSKDKINELGYDLYIIELGQIRDILNDVYSQEVKLAKIKEIQTKLREIFAGEEVIDFERAAETVFLHFKEISELLKNMEG